MSRIGKVHHSVVSISDENGSLSNLGRAVVDRVHLEAVHVVAGIRGALKVAGKETHDRSGLLVRIEWRPTFFGSLGNRSVAQCRRQEPSHVFHEEKPRLNVLNKSKELPQKRSSWVLGRPSFPRGAERLTRRPAHNEVHLSAIQPHRGENVGGVDAGDVALKHFQIRWQSTRSVVLPNRLAKGSFLLDARDNFEAARSLKPQVETHATREQRDHAILPSNACHAWRISDLLPPRLPLPGRTSVLTVSDFEVLFRGLPKASRGLRTTR